MSELNIGDYKLIEDGNGTLTVEEKSTGETAVFDGNQLSFSSFGSNVDGKTNELTNLGRVATQSFDMTEDAVIGVGTNGNLKETYEVADYADVLDAAQAAEDDLPARGGAIIVPPGKHTASTQLRIDVPTALITATQFEVHSHYNNGENSASTLIEWSGSDTTPAVLVRASDRTPISGGAGQVLEGVTIGPIFFHGQDTAETAIRVEGTTGSPNSIVRDLLFRGTAVSGWDAGAPAIDIEGTVFAVYAEGPVAFGNASDAFATYTGGSPSAGPVSEVYIYRPRMFSPDNGNHALRIDSNHVSVHGGSIQQGADGSHGIKVLSTGSGGIYGTRFEGDNSNNTFAGGIGIIIGGPQSAGFTCRPAIVSKWDYGVSVGDGTGSDTQNVEVLMGSGPNANNTADVWIRSGAARDGVAILNTTNSVIDDRSGTDGVEEVGGRVDTVRTREFTIPVDTTGAYTDTINVGKHPVWDEVSIDVVGTDDGSGNNVTDFELGAPVTQGKDGSNGIDVYVPRLTASATSGATATLQMTAKSYTYLG